MANLGLYGFARGAAGTLRQGMQERRLAEDEEARWKRKQDYLAKLKREKRVIQDDAGNWVEETVDGEGTVVMSRDLSASEVKAKEREERGAELGLSAAERQERLGGVEEEFARPRAAAGLEQIRAQTGASRAAAGESSLRRRKMELDIQEAEELRGAPVEVQVRNAVQEDLRELSSLGNVFGAAAERAIQRAAQENPNNRQAAMTAARKYINEIYEKAGPAIQKSKQEGALELRRAGGSGGLDTLFGPTPNQ